MGRKSKGELNHWALIQGKIIRCMQDGRERTVSDISRHAALKMEECKYALTLLKRRGMISKQMLDGLSVWSMAKDQSKPEPAPEVFNGYEEWYAHAMQQDAKNLDFVR